MKQVGNTILAKGVNHILAKRDNSAWPKGAKLSGFSKQQYSVHQQQYALSSIPSHRLRYTARLCQKRRSPQHPNNCLRARRISGETLLPLPHYKPKRSRPTATRHLSVHSVISLSPALSATAETHLQKEKPYTTGLI